MRGEGPGVCELAGRHHAVCEYFIRPKSFAFLLALFPPRSTRSAQGSDSVLSRFGILSLSSLPVRLCPYGGRADAARLQKLGERA